MIKYTSKIISPSLLLFSFFLLNIFNCYAADDIVISGKITNKNSGEEIIGAVIFIKELKTGTATNENGFYSYKIKKGTYQIKFSALGFVTVEKDVTLSENTSLNIELEEKSTEMKEVVISSEKENSNVMNTEMSVTKLDAKTIKKIPALMGEVDVIKAIQLLPGTLGVSEGSTGYSVRGGSMSQNLILFDGAPIYNASHLFGFFSIFNNDVVKDVKLYKGDFPAEYGGRLSSVLDVKTKNGNMNNITGSGGIGIISSRFSLEGPIWKNKCSFLISARRSYADLLFRLFSNGNTSQLYFYDLNLKLKYNINAKNSLSISGYSGSDVFDFDRFKRDWSNNAVVLKWNHVFNSKLFSSYSIITSGYKNNIGLNSITSINTSQQQGRITGPTWQSNIKSTSLKADFEYFLNSTNTLKFGANSIYHQIKPGDLSENQGQSVNLNSAIPNSNGLENSLYLQNTQKLYNNLNINYGLRYTLFQNIGQSTVYNYDNNYNVIDSTVYNQNKVYNTFQGLEPRINITYLFNNSSSIKISYSKTIQYLVLAVNSVAGSGTDLWLPASPNIKPQIANQAAIGYFRNFKDNMFESSVELYIKDISNQLEFKDNAQILQNPRIEGEIRAGKAKAYGIEFFIRKNKGKLTGWVAYTYSRTQNKINGISNGNWFPASYDKPHNISIVSNYQLNKKWSFSATWVYSTGAPATFPSGRFTYNGSIAPVYSERNSSRLPDYHRLDLGATYDFKENPKRKFHSSLNFSVYNAYNRQNAFQILFGENNNDNTKTEAYRVSLFPIIPSLTYNFQF